MSFKSDEILRAISEARSLAPKRNFTEAVEISVGLRNIDLKDPSKRFSFELPVPNDISKETNIAVIADGDLATKSHAAGLKVISNEDLESLGKNPRQARKIANQFNFFVAMAPLMPLTARHLGKILGPRGKMPTPIPPTADITPIAERYKRIVRLRLRGQPCINCKVGTLDNSDEELAENTSTILSALTSRLDSGIGQIRGVHVKTTMGPSVKVGN